MWIIYRAFLLTGPEACIRRVLQGVSVTFSMFWNSFKRNILYYIWVLVYRFAKTKYLGGLEPADDQLELKPDFELYYNISKHNVCVRLFLLRELCIL